jgi:DNA-binding CsgD family transcriptional regulator
VTLADRLEPALTRCRTVEALAGVVLAAVPAEVPFAFGCLATTDPLTGVVTWAYKSHPLPTNDEEWSAVEYGEPDVNQFAEIARRDVPAGVLSIDTGGRPELCRRFRDFLAPRFGFTDELRVAYRARGLMWGGLALYRGPDEPPFTERDAHRLVAVGSMITEAIRRTLFAADAVPAETPPEPAVIILDEELKPRQMTRAARNRIEDLGGWYHGSLPSGLLGVAARARTSDEVVATRTQLASGQWLAIRGSCLEESGVVLTIDLARPAELQGLTLIGRGLTERELEIAGLVVKGASTKAIAAALHLSPHTVQDHLKAIFVKLGINSRRQLVAQLYG